MKERNIKRFEQRQLELDKSFESHCAMCDQRYTNRENILLPPKELYAMAKELNITPEEVFEKYCEAYIGFETKIPVVRIKMVGSDRKCPLLKDRKCLVHNAKPTICALFPVECFLLTEKLESQLVNKKTGYFFEHPDCSDDPETQIVCTWMNVFGIPFEGPFFVVWQDALLELSTEIQRIEKSVDYETMCDIWKMVFSSIYLDYDMEQDFMEQFTEKQDTMISLLKTLPLSKGGKK